MFLHAIKECDTHADGWRRGRGRASRLLDRVELGKSISHASHAPHPVRHSGGFIRAPTAKPRSCSPRPDARHIHTRPPPHQLTSALNSALSIAGLSLRVGKFFPPHHVPVNSTSHCAQVGVAARQRSPNRLSRLKHLLPGPVTTGLFIHNRRVSLVEETLRRSD